MVSQGWALLRGATGVLVLAAALSCLAPREARATDLSGVWRGTWTSCTTGHTGTLNARFVRVDACTYRVIFTGRFWKVFPFAYREDLYVVQDGPVVRLKGSSEMRILGTFYYDAVANRCEFHATYRACKDHGRFDLCRTVERVGGCCQ